MSPAPVLNSVSLVRARTFSSRLAAFTSIRTSLPGIRRTTDSPLVMPLKSCWSRW